MLVIGTFLPQVGGAEVQALAHARALGARGCVVQILTLRHHRSWPRAQVMDGIPVLRLAGMICGDRERYPAPLRRVSYLLGTIMTGLVVWRRRRAYDVICNFQLNWLTLPVALAARLAGRPMVLALRSADSSARPPQREVAPLAQAIPWLPAAAGQNETGDLEMLASMGPLAGGLLRWLLRGSAMHLVVLSARMRAELSQRGFALERIQLIPNGVEVRRFAPEAGREEATASRTVVCVCRLAYSKGVDLLLQAWHLVHQRIPDARLVVVGAGPLREQLERLADALDVRDAVEFVGARDDVPAQLNRGAIAVLPSRWEGMPNALLEAMACGCACVATRVSGSEDLIESGVHGLLVEPGDYPALADALVALLADADLRARLGAAARQRMVEHFSADHVAALYQALYERMTPGVAVPVEHAESLTAP